METQDNLTNNSCVLFSFSVCLISFFVFVFFLVAQGAFTFVKEPLMTLASYSPASIFIVLGYRLVPVYTALNSIIVDRQLK